MAPQKLVPKRSGCGLRIRGVTLILDYPVTLFQPRGAWHQVRNTECSIVNRYQIKEYHLESAEETYLFKSRLGVMSYPFHPWFVYHIYPSNRTKQNSMELFVKAKFYFKSTRNPDWTTSHHNSIRFVREINQCLVKVFWNESDYWELALVSWGDMT